MFYEPATGHGLPHDPLNAIVAPRPIGWISTRGRLGDNLAPYSFFNAVAYTPPQVMFATTSGKADRPRGKDTAAQAEESGVFCVNIVGWAARAAMNATSAALPAGADEFEAAGVARAPCTTIDCPRVADAPAALECRVTEIVALKGRGNLMVLGEVTGIHLRDDCLAEGRFDVLRAGLIGRLGYRDYVRVAEVFAMPRPGEG
ncbi:MAG: flavin reductase family protein [Gemmobacter sp.]|jgi:flavin reductase (DIM6/NTAB) family NADH-FMN oxidoreductase RutF